MKTFNQLKGIAGKIVDNIQKDRMNEAVFSTVTGRKTKALEMATLVGMVTAASFERKIDPAIIELYLNNVNGYEYRGTMRVSNGMLDVYAVKVIEFLDGMQLSSGHFKKIEECLVKGMPADEAAKVLKAM
jgi:hypothetical protein